MRRGRRSPGSPTATGPGRQVRTSTAAVAPATPTGNPLGSSKLARQVAILGIVLCAVALSLAYPLRNYIDQRAQLAAAVADQRSLERQVAELQLQQAALSDPDYLRAEAKKRLQYVMPGDTVYVVHAPDLAAPTDDQTATEKSGVPWYSTLWDTLAANGGGPAVGASVLSPAAPAAETSAAEPTGTASGTSTAGDTAATPTP